MTDEDKSRRTTDGVTIVVPTRNSARTIVSCLRSIRSQTLGCKVIVVDNGSSDDTTALADRLADVVISGGSERSAQRNRGAELAPPKAVLGFIDADMVVGTTVVEEASAAIAAGAVGVIVPESTVGRGYWARVRAFERAFYDGSDAVEACRFFPRWAFDAAGGFDERLTGAEDWDLSDRIRAIGPVTRVRARIFHDEDGLRFLQACRKKGGYAEGLRRYVHLRGTSALQGHLVHRPWLSQPRRLCSPLGVGLLALKAGESIAVATALLRSTGNVDGTMRSRPPSKFEPRVGDAIPRRAVSRRPAVRALEHVGEDGLRCVRSAWEELIATVPSLPPYSKPAWAGAWCSVYGGHHLPIVLEFRHDGRPVGIVPLQRTVYPGMHLRRIEFLSGGPTTRRHWLVDPGFLGQALYNQALVLPGFEQQTVTAFRKWLHARLDWWDELRLNCVPTTSPLVAAFRDLAGAWNPSVQLDSTAYVDTALGWPAYRSRLSKRQRRHLRYEPNILSRVAGGKPELRVTRGEDVRGLFGSFIELHTRRWAAAGRLVVTPENRLFHRRLSEQRDLNPVVYSLVVGDWSLAMQFGFDDGLRYIPQVFAFDPTLRQASAANVLLHYIIRQCCEDGHAEVDLAALAGVERWAGDTRQRAHLVARAPGLRATLRANSTDVISRSLVRAYGSPVGHGARRAVEGIRRWSRNT